MLYPILVSFILLCLQLSWGWEPHTHAAYPDGPPGPEFKDAHRKHRKNQVRNSNLMEDRRPRHVQ